MAFLIGPALGALASLFAPTIARKLTGRGGAVRRKKTSLAQLLAALNAPSAKIRTRRTRGGALAVMNKWPAIERPARFAIGGNLPYGPLNQLLIGRGDPSGMHLVKGFTERLFGGPPRFMPAHMARNPRPHMVRAHLSRSALGKPEMVRAHMASGLITSMAGVQPGLSSVMRGGLLGFTPSSRGGRVSPRPHFVRPHMAVSDLGHPYFVRGHMAAGLVAPHKVRSHARITPTGNVTRVRSHVKGMGLLGY